MKKYFLACIILTVIVSCTKEKNNQTTMNQKHINNNLPTIGILLFGVTTSSGIYAQIEVLVRYVLGEGKKAEKMILTIYKWSYPIPGLLLVIFAVANGLPGTSVWLFADMSTALPIFANLLVLLLLSGKFFSLLKDYKARYMGIGEVDPNFKVFYEDDQSENEKIG